MSSDAYTIEMQGTADGETWQALSTAELVLAEVFGDTDADDVARAFAAHQNITEGSQRRVLVWEGADTGTEPAAVNYPGHA